MSHSRNLIQPQIIGIFIDFSTFEFVWRWLVFLGSHRLKVGSQSVDADFILTVGTHFVDLQPSKQTLSMKDMPTERNDSQHLSIFYEVNANSASIFSQIRMVLDQPVKLLFRYKLVDLGRIHSPDQIVRIDFIVDCHFVLEFLVFAWIVVRLIDWPRFRSAYNLTSAIYIDRLRLGLFDLPQKFHTGRAQLSRYQNH